MKIKEKTVILLTSEEITEQSERIFGDEGQKENEKETEDENEDGCNGLAECFARRIEKRMDSRRFV